MPRIFRRLTIGGCAMSLLLSANPSAMAQQALTGSGQGQRDPISIGILLEASRDFASRLDAARNGIDLFLDALEPEDEVFLMTFSDIPALKSVVAWIGAEMGIRPFPSGSVRRYVRTQAVRVRSLCSELSGRP